MAVQGYCPGGTAGPVPPAPPRPPVKRSVMGGGHYEVPPKELCITDILEEAQDKSRTSELDLRPALMKRLIEESKSERAKIQKERERMQAERKELEDLRKGLFGDKEELRARARELDALERQIRAETKLNGEESAIAMKDRKRIIDAVSMFHGGTVMPLTMVRPILEKQKNKNFFEEYVKPLGIGMAVGAGLTIAAIIVSNMYDSWKKSAPQRRGKKGPEKGAAGNEEGGEETAGGDEKA